MQFVSQNASSIDRAATGQLDVLALYYFPHAIAFSQWCVIDPSTLKACRPMNNGASNYRRFFIVM